MGFRHRYLGVTANKRDQQTGSLPDLDVPSYVWLCGGPTSVTRIQPGREGEGGQDSSILLASGDGWQSNSAAIENRAADRR